MHVFTNQLHTPQSHKHMVYVSGTKQDQPLKGARSSSPPPAYVYTQQQPAVVQQPVKGNPPGDQFLMSIFTIFCCFMPFGVVALVKSVEVSINDEGRHLVYPLKCSLCKCDIVFHCRPVKPTRVDVSGMLLLLLVWPKPSTSGLLSSISSCLALPLACTYYSSSLLQV